MHVQRAQSHGPRSHGKGIPWDDTVISSMHVQRVCHLSLGCYRHRNTILGVELKHFFKPNTSLQSVIDNQHFETNHTFLPFFVLRRRAYKKYSRIYMIVEVKLQLYVKTKYTIAQHNQLPTF